MPCNAEAPHLQKLSESVRRRGGLVVGVAMANDSREGVEKFRRRHALTYPIAFDRDDRFDSETTDVPSTVLVDARGVVRWLEEGYDEESFAALERRFRALLPKP
jgi:peroxiredoxin